MLDEKVSHELVRTRKGEDKGSPATTLIDQAGLYGEDKRDAGKEEKAGEIGLPRIAIIGTGAEKPRQREKKGVDSAG